MHADAELIDAASDPVCVPPLINVCRMTGDSPCSPGYIQRCLIVRHRSRGRNAGRIRELFDTWLVHGGLDDSDSLRMWFIRNGACTLYAFPQDARGCPRSNINPSVKKMKTYLLRAVSLTTAGASSRGSDLGGPKSARLRGIDFSSVESDGEPTRLATVLARFTLISVSL